MLYKNVFFYQKFLLFFYIIINIFLAFYFLYKGELGGDLIGYDLKDNYVMIESLFLVILSFFIVYAIYRANLKIFLKFKTKNINYNYYYVSVFLVCYNVLFLYLILSGAYGGAGKEANGKYSALISFVTLFSPVYLSIIYAFFFVRKKSKIYNLNILLSIVSFVLQAYIGYFIYILVLLIVRVFYLKGVFSISRKYIFLMTIFILLVPVLRILKVLLMNSNSNDDMFFIYQSLQHDAGGGFFQLYLNFMIITIERFQQVANVYFVAMHQYILNGYIDSNYVHLAYIDGSIQTFLIKLVGTLKSVDIQTKLAYLISGNSNWRSQVGFAGWFFISPLYFILNIVLAVLYNFIFNIVSYLSGGVRELSHAYFLFSILLVCHGWFNDIIIVISSSILFLIILYASSFKVRDL